MGNGTAVTRQRWVRALLRVRAVERRAAGLRPPLRPRRFRYAGRAAWATPAGRAILPPRVGAERDDAERTLGPVGAEAVLLGKFDVGHEVRLRAFYPDPGLTQRYQAGGARNGVDRSLTAWATVAPHDSALMPAVTDSGVLRRRRGAWLLEHAVAGRPARPAELSGLLEPVAERLHRVQRAVGIDNRRLSTLVHHEFARRWQGFVDGHLVEPRLAAAVHRLIGRDDELQVSFGHGDLVGSNILLVGGGFVLIDWEFAGERPIAFDLAKLHLTADDHAEAQAALERGLGRRSGTGPGHYTFAEQLALAHVQALTWHELRARKARAAGRSGALEAMNRRQLESVGQLLGTG